MDLATAAAAPLTVAGLAEELSPPTLGDLATIEAWAKRTGLAEVEEELALLDKYGATPEQKQARLTAFFDSLKNGTNTERFVKSIEGLRVSVLTVLRHKRPDVNDADVGDLVTIQNMDAVRDALDRSVDGAAPPNAGTASVGSIPPSPAPTGNASTPAS